MKCSIKRPPIILNRRVMQEETQEAATDGVQTGPGEQVPDKVQVSAVTADQAVWEGLADQGQAKVQAIKGGKAPL